MHHHMADIDYGLRIDHSGDPPIVNPTESKMSAPAGGH